MVNETHYLMVQDADHSMTTGMEVVIPAMTAFIYSVITGHPRPTMTWEWYNGTTEGSITVTTSEVPVAVNVWHGDTLVETRRDWRLLTGTLPCPAPIEEGGTMIGTVDSKLMHSSIFDHFYVNRMSTASNVVSL